MRARILFLLVVAAVSTLESQSDRPVIREEQIVVVDGATETWRLEWKSAPRPVCGAESANWNTCPCSGFAYGQAGMLDLVRLRNGREIDRLPLTPLFADSDNLPPNKSEAILQRWEPQESDSPDSAGLAERVTLRPLVKAMRLADYDHDGAATEFFLQTNTSPCGKRMGMVVGLSRGNRRLHAFSLADKPDAPLVLWRGAWEALRDSEGTEITTWACGDHGADIESTTRLNTSADGIHEVDREYQCTGNGRGRLLSKTAK